MTSAVSGRAAANGRPKNNVLALVWVPCPRLRGHVGAGAWRRKRRHGTMREEYTGSQHAT
jgi:hypothetical protein